MARGHAVCHASGVRHAGNVISGGVRWVLVVFVLAQAVPQLTRRCAERAALSKAEAHAAMTRGADPAEVQYMCIGLAWP